ncbi:glycosyltransferase family 4 protein [uncultured Pseudodesulfovibrio sp.]|uniref:glycosyltransferase family 4 protein n=1 Tax=uncultured Pseudodesulfovibrio sp. TaxID=2035858 RepID=UPI0029C94869|nr:glycosyltransferase family 4 protein [uncultured Pseudodesulfovibrio sp.]
MKILAVSRIPLGGIRTYIRYVYSRLGADVEVTLVACSGPESKALQADAEGYGGRVVLCDNSALSLAQAVRRELRSGRYDILHSHGFLSGTSSYLGSLGLRVPHVLTIHGIVEERFLTGLVGKIKKWVLGWVVTGVDVVHCVGEDMMDHMVEKVPALARHTDRMALVASGIDSKLFASYEGDVEALREELKLEPDTYLFGFLGRFMPQKGLDLVIKAVSEITTQGGLKPFKVICCGSGDYINEYRHEIALAKLEDKFLFLPFRGDPRDVLNLVDAVVMPSRWEAFGLLAAEVLASGKPLIASTCIGLREVVRETPALTIPSEDWQALAEAMRRTVNEDHSKAFREYQPTAIERFDVQKTADGLKALFAELAAKGAPR